MKPVAKKDVLFLGWEPSSLDLSDFPPHMSNLTLDSIQQGIEATSEALQTAGYTFDSKMHDASITPSELADLIDDLMRDTEYKVIVIGNGVRSIPKYMLHFEAAVNAIMRSAGGSGTKLAFNTVPQNTIDAVKRWL